MMLIVRYCIILLVLSPKLLMGMESADNINQQLLSIVDSERHQNPSVQQIETLLKQGADVNARDGYGATPLIHEIRAQYSDLAIIEMLCKNGADTNLTDILRNTPLHFAVSEDNQKAIPLLLNFHANIESKNCDTYTPIDLIYKYGRSGSGYALLLNQHKTLLEERKQEESQTQVEKERLLRQQRCLKTDAEYNRVTDSDSKNARAMKCSDACVPGAYVWPIAPGFQSTSSGSLTPEYRKGASYYPKEYYYAFNSTTIFRTPSTDGIIPVQKKYVPDEEYVGQITVLTPYGNPDPKIIREPFGIITGFSVNEANRRQGHGKLLLRKAFDTIKEMGLKKAVLNVERGEENRAAISLYTNEGFIPDESQEGYVMYKNFEGK